MRLLKITEEIMRKLEIVKADLECAFPMVELQAVSASFAKGDCSGCAGSCRGTCKKGRDNCLLKM